jgi:hypothetical protein
VVLSWLEQSVTDRQQAQGEGEQADERGNKHDVHQGYSRIEVIEL